MKTKKYSIIFLALLTSCMLFSGCSAVPTDAVEPQGTAIPPWTELPGSNMPDIPKNAPAS